jgi:RNA recognition motif-containing protein
MVRLYVGGLQEDTTPEMVAARFTQFGTVSSCELARNKAGCTTGTPGTCRGFAHVVLEPTSEQALHRCLSIVSSGRQVYRAF